jgi:molybdopterin-synthase adenylyltransferase
MMGKTPHNFNDELKKIKDKSNKLTNGISVISIRKVKYMAQKYNLSPLEVEIAALQKEIVPVRYERNYDTISIAEQIRLLQSNVAVIGCGGLGGNIIELLARLGIGNLIVIDGDIFNESNINRQLLCTEDNIGKGKAETAAERIKHINSSINSKTYSQFINSKNIHKIIQGADLTVDALDTIPSRFVLEKACNYLNIPLIHGAVNGFNGQVSTIFPDDKGLEAIYGTLERYDTQDNTSQVSVPSITPALVASFQAAEVVKVLLNKGKLLRNRLLLLNTEELAVNVLEIN